MNFLINPKNIKISDIKNKEYSLHPNEHKNVIIKNKNLVSIKDIVDFEDVGKQIDTSNYVNFTSDYYLGTISCMNNLIFDSKKSENITSLEFENSKKKLNKNDLVISRNATLGKISIIKDNINLILNGGLSYLRINNELLRYYFMSFFIVDFGASILKLKTSGGGTQKNAKKEDLLNMEIPFPTKENNNNPEDVKQMVSLIVQNIIDKEEQIKNKNKNIDYKIKNEINNTGLIENFINTKKISYLKDNNYKMDSGIYGELVSEVNIMIERYKGGHFLLNEYYNYSRGQNLQVSQIGESIYSKDINNKFYKLVTNVEMQDNRTISGFRYLGNPNKLKTLPKNGILFAADGAIVGRSFFFDYLENTITNLHPWVITSKDKNTEIYNIVYVSLFLSYLKNIGYLDKIKDKSNGGGLKGEHLEKWIKIPNFEKTVKQDIAKEYYNLISKNNLNFENYLQKEKSRNKEIGIYQLNMELFSLKEKLNDIVGKIVMNEKIDIDLEY